MKIPKPSEYRNRVKGMGWIPDHPKIEDWPWGAHRMAGRLTLPTVSPDRRALGQNAPVFDQGNEGSCVGCSSAYGVYFLDNIDKDKIGALRSPQQIYFDARVAEGPQFQHVDGGAYIRECMNQLRAIGASTERVWPYSRKFDAKPSVTAYKVAATWKLGAHYRLTGVRQIMEAIDAGYAVIGGISCYSNMFTAEVDRTGRIPMPVAGRDRFEGGHALYFDRYNQSDRLVEFENTWGIRWGSGGYGYAPFEYLDDPRLADDFWAMQKEAPETTPWKD